jgi:hypothetical protein
MGKGEGTLRSQHPIGMLDLLISDDDRRPGERYSRSPSEMGWSKFLHRLIRSARKITMAFSIRQQRNCVGSAPQLLVNIAATIEGDTKKGRRREAPPFSVQGNQFLSNWFLK